MDEEIASIEKNDIWKLVFKPKRKKLIGVKWIYKEKKNTKGEVERYKARLVAKCYKGIAKHVFFSNHLRCYKKTINS